MPSIFRKNSVAPAPANVSLGEAKYNRTTNTITFSNSPLVVVNPKQVQLEPHKNPTEAWPEATSGGKKKKASKPKATKKK